MIPLPDWVPVDLWEAYVAQRKKDRKALCTATAARRLAELTAWKNAGHDPATVIEEALNGHWLKFYEPREVEVTRKAKTTDGADAWRAQHEEARRASQTPEAMEAKRRALSAIKRVA